MSTHIYLFREPSITVIKKPNSEQFLIMLKEKEKDIICVLQNRESAEKLAAYLNIELEDLERREKDV